MNSGTIKGDFIQMRDQKGVGSVKFYAGTHSTNIGNSNENWIFDAPSDYVDEGVLGKDVVLCKNQTLVLDANTFSPGEKYRWSNGSTNAQLTVSTPGIYWVDLTYANNCVIRDSVKVLAPASFNPNLPNDTILCAGEKLLLNADVKLVGVKYVWQDSTRLPTYTVSTSGKYKVSLELSGCKTADSLNVTVNPLPKVNLGPDQTLCQGQSATLNATTTGGTYQWQDNSTSPTFKVTQPGTYSVALKVSRCLGRDTVVVNYQPAIGLELGRDTSFCENSSYTITANVSNVTYRWNDASTNNSLLVKQPGTYRLSVTRSGCTETDSIKIGQQLLPKFDLGKDTLLCEGQKLTLNGTVVGASYQWNDGLTQPTRIIQTPGLFWLEEQIRGCKKRDSINIKYTTIPNNVLGKDSTLCEGQSFSLNLNVPGAAYLWQDATTLPTYTVRQTGRYTVQLKIGSCTKTDTLQATFNPLPKFDLGRDTVLCDGQKLTLNGTVTGASYQWNDGLTQPTRIIQTPGLFWLEEQLKGCKKRDSINIKYTTIPNNILGKDSTLCEGQSFSLKLNVLGAAYVWQDGTTLPTYTVRQTGRYTVQVKVGSCTKTDTLQATFNPLPKFDLGRDTVLCEGQKLTLNGTVAGVSYQWNDGLTQPTRIIQTTGLFWLEEQLSGCKKRDSIKIQFTTIPNQILGRDTSLCEGQIYPLKLSVPGAVYLWQDGSVSNQFTIKQAGTYSVKLSLGNCGKSDTLIAKYNPLPRFNLGRDTALCQGESLNLNMKVVADLYRWENGSPSSSRGVAATGVYIGKATLKGCSFSDTIKIDVKNLSTINLGKDTLVCDDHPLVLTSNIKTGNLLWSDGSTGTTLETTAPGIYWLKISEGRCQKADTVKVTFRHCAVFQLYAPNAFSPNKDNVNDVFLPGISPEITVMQYSMLIFNRWGNLIFETEDYTQGWDGTVGHKDVPDGVYIYVIQLKYRDDKGEGSKKIAGDVTLIH
jgi:gliding motility-associated-like protein